PRRGRGVQADEREDSSRCPEARRRTQSAGGRGAGCAPKAAGRTGPRVSNAWHRRSAPSLLLPERDRISRLVDLAAPRAQCYHFDDDRERDAPNTSRFPPSSRMRNRLRYLRKPSVVVAAVRLDLDTNGFTYRKWGAEQCCKRGDWLVDNDGDVYTVDA